MYFEKLLINKNKFDDKIIPWNLFRWWNAQFYWKTVRKKPKKNELNVVQEDKKNIICLHITLIILNQDNNVKQ